MPKHPDRVLPLQGATNFRDLGGYVGLNGRTVRWRRLFRSEHLGGLSEGDQQVLADLRVTRAFDFRGAGEAAAASYQLPGVQRHALAIEPTVVQRMQALAEAGQALTGPRVAGLMRDLYRGLANEQAHRYAELFEHLLQVDAPVVFHCTAGKDRTGFAAALILLALGVQRDVVMQDYLLTNEVFKHPPQPDSDIPAEALAVLWRVQEGFLEAALQTVDAEHGGIEPYLSRKLGLGAAALQTLRARYLQSSDAHPHSE
jgi:protein-tyrosine phosphatase